MSKITIIEVNLGTDIDAIISEGVEELTGAAKHELDQAIQLAKQRDALRDKKEASKKESDNAVIAAMDHAYQRLANAGVDGGHNMGMWDPNSGGWGAGEDLGSGRAAESRYGEEAASDHQYGEVNHERGARPNPVKEKERASEREWSGSSDRRNREDKDAGYERDIPREKDVGHGYDMPERRHRDDRDTGREREREHHHKDRERS